MAKPTSQERRKQILRQRRAEEQREIDREEARYLFGDALRAQRSGDIPAADRFLKKALVLDPNLGGAMGVPADIHLAAGRHAEALGRLQQRRKVDADPTSIFNIAVIQRHLGQSEKAIEAMREFLSAIKGRHEPEWQRMRGQGEAFVQLTKPTPAREKPAPPPAPELERLIFACV
jgi:tetratricopeptide (TPR) repeat protein